MKRGLILISIILTLFLLGCQVQSNQILQDISPQDALELLNENQDNPNFVLLDVRTQEEFETQSIAGATQLDFYNESFDSKLNELNKDNTYLIYCGSGKRGAMTLDKMKDLEFKEAYNIEGGLKDCQDVGFNLTS